MCVCAGLGVGPGAAAPVIGHVAAAETQASSPPLAWRGTRRLQVLCVVVSDEPAERRSLEVLLCERVRLLAGKGGRLPVSVIAPGDPAVLASDATTLLVHASVQAGAHGRLLAFSVRPFRVSDEQSAVLFGAAPRAVDLAAPDGTRSSLDAALDASLGVVLPWRAEPLAPRPIR